MSQVAFSFPSHEMAYSGDSHSRYRQWLLDKTKIEYGASLLSDDIKDALGKQTDAITSSIREASDRQVTAINDAGNKVASAVQKGAEQIVDSIKEAEAAICNGLDNIGDLLSSLNRRMDLSIEQQKMTNLLLGNIVELLKIPDSEKERQQAISLGIKFFVNAGQHPELYKDSLDYLLKAEQLQPQDYFVLHRIGCIYLYVDYLLDPAKALDYFSRAAKYAEAESSPNAVRLANILSNSINSDMLSIGSDPTKILLLAADSYEKAAFAAYVDDKIDSAIELQKKALSLAGQPENDYNLSKYLAHKGETKGAIHTLGQAIDAAPKYAVAVFQDMDFLSRPDIVLWVKEKSDSLDSQLQDIIRKTQNPDVALRVEDELKNGSYISKCRILRRAIKLDKSLQS